VLKIATYRVKSITMKPFRPTIRQPQQIFAALILTGILSLGAGMTLVNTATANSVESSQGAVNLKQSRTRKLPPSVIDAISRDINRSAPATRPPLVVVTFSQESWSDSCLGLGKLDELCGQIFIENGWRVVMSDGEQKWVYRSDNTGRTVRLEGQDTPSSSNLPSLVANAVLQLASKELGVASSRLQITKAQQQTWGDACLGLPSPVERCMGTPTPGWRVVVEGRQQSQVYRTDSTASRIRAEGINGQPPNTAGLPSAISRAVLRDAQKRSRLPVSQLRILQAETVEWSDGCLGLAEPDVVCTQALVPGWKVTVVGGQQTFVYRTDESGSLVKFDGTPSQGSNGSVPIPSSELPPPLQRNVIFRAIASGGITGRTYETRLMNDGRVIRGLIDPSGTTVQPDIRKISRQQVRQFQQLLEQQRFSQFNQLSYPAPRGAADYISVTLTSQSGTTRYADIIQNQLPPSLRSVIQSWNQLASGR